VRHPKNETGVGSQGLDGEAREMEELPDVCRSGFEKSDRKTPVKGLGRLMGGWARLNCGEKGTELNGDDSGAVGAVVKRRKQLKTKARETGKKRKENKGGREEEGKNQKIPSLLPQAGRKTSLREKEELLSLRRERKALLLK
jgi:hypothetical protein